MDNKTAARKWLAEQIKGKKPLPSQEEIRRQMGWTLIKAKRS